MRRVLLASCVLVVSAGTSEAWSAAPKGSWIAYGHDFQRTGHADGAGSMKAPKVAWTLQQGGLLTVQQALLADVDGDGRPEVLNISGGRLTASRADGSTLWKGDLPGPRAVLGAWNLDGTGSLEVIADTPNGVLVLAGTDGHVLTTLATTGPVNATFVPESKGGILVLAASEGSLAGYDFRNGTAVTTPTWSITGANQTIDLAGDVDGDGVIDLVRPLDDGFEVDDPLTGATKYSLPGMSPPAYFYNYELANVDGAPGVEIVAVDTSYFYSPTTGVYVVGVQGGVLKTLWSSTASPLLALGADFESVSGAAADLDGDGKVEIVFSRWDGTQQTWTTTVADAVTGAVLGTMAGQIVQGIGDIDGDGRRDVIVRSGVLGSQLPVRSTVTAYDFDSRQAGPVAKTWTLPVAHLMPTMGLGLPTPAIADFDPNTPGLELLVGQDETNQGQDTRLAIVHGKDGSLAQTLSVAVTVHPAVVGVVDHASATTSRNDIVTAADDGNAQVLDGTLSVHSTFTAGTYANWVYGFAGPAGHANLFAATSNNHLRWVDGRQLHVDGTPYVRFDEPAVVATAPLAAAGYPLDPVVFLDGASPTFVTFEQGQSAITLVAHDASGVETWRMALADGTTIAPPGAYALDLTGDGKGDLVLCLNDISSLESIAVFDGVTGNLLRSTAITSVISGSDAMLTGSLVDVNGDNHLDLVVPEHVHGVVAVDLTQQPFAELWLAPIQGTQPPALNGTIGAASLGNANGTDLLRSNGNNGFGPYLRISTGGSVLALGNQGLPQNQPDDKNAAVIVSRGGGAFDVISAGTSNVGLSRIRRVAGDTLAAVWTQYAAQGTVSASPPAVGYAFHDPVALDVDGNGTDDAVFGADDGYLYAVNSSDGSLLFTVNLGAPVVHLIAANVDLDPELELVASIADGRLVAIDDNYTANVDQPDAGMDATADASLADSGPQPEGGALDGAADACDNGNHGGSGGGCSCRAGGEPARWSTWALAVIPLGLAAARRFRKRSRRGQVDARPCERTSIG
jgi:MYXO-CTERM domain-containing protein